ncbi:MAG: hypothetical protein JSR96_07055 [Proteobacteria bacterium]|nr:hypothetical protein [Pseudomonadota bacterium]
MAIRALAVPLCAALILIPAAVHAQSSDGESGDDRVAAMIAAAKDTYSAVPPRASCQPGDDDEIVVCARTDSSKYRVPSTAESDPNSLAARRARDGAIPSAPDLVPQYHGVSAARGCFVPPCPPPPIYYIDVKALPEAPAGSDADKIARGEKAAP